MASHMILLPPDPLLRHVRAKTVRGWRKSRSRIRTEADVAAFMGRVAATDTFYGVARWGTPTRVGRADQAPVLVGCDLAFDFDAPPGRLGTAARAARLLHEAMRDEPYVLQPGYPAFTGQKGYRLVYTPTYGLPAQTTRRLLFLADQRRLLVDRLLRRLSPTQWRSVAASWDVAVTLNPFAVIRVLGTPHGRSGLASEPCDLSVHAAGINHGLGEPGRGCLHGLHPSPAPFFSCQCEASPSPRWEAPGGMMTGPALPPCAGGPQPQVDDWTGAPRDACAPVLFFADTVSRRRGTRVVFLTIPSPARSPTPSPPFAKRQTPPSVKSFLRRWTAGPGRRLGPLYLCEATDGSRYGLCLAVTQRRELLGLLRRLHDPLYHAVQRGRPVRKPWPLRVVAHTPNAAPQRGHSRAHAALLPPAIIPPITNWTVGRLHVEAGAAS